MAALLASLPRYSLAGLLIRLACRRHTFSPPHLFWRRSFSASAWTGMPSQNVRRRAKRQLARRKLEHRAPPLRQPSHSTLDTTIQAERICRSGRGRAHTQSWRHSRCCPRPRSMNPVTQSLAQPFKLREFAGREGGKRKLNHGDTQDAARAPAQVTQSLTLWPNHSSLENSQVGKGASANSIIVTLKMLRAPPLKIEQAHH